jgi:hypothetical protein
MPELPRAPGRMSARARDALSRALGRAAASVERNRVETGDETYFPTLHGRLHNQDLTVEKKLARKLHRRRARVRRGLLGAWRSRAWGMRRLRQRAERTEGHLDVSRGAHKAAGEELEGWKKEVGPSALVPVIPRLLFLLLATIGAVAETLFSSGAAEFLIATTGVIPGWAEEGLSFALAFFFGLGALLLTKWGIEEAMLIRRSRRQLLVGDVANGAPWSGRSPWGRVVRVSFALLAVVGIIFVSAELRDSAAAVKAGATAQPVQAAESLGKSAAADSDSPVDKLNGYEFLALGVGTAMLMAALTLIAMDPVRIHTKRLSTSERWSRWAVAFWNRRHGVALRLVEIAYDRDANAVRTIDLALASHRVTSSNLLLDVADGHPGLFGNAWPDREVPLPLRDLGLSSSSEPEFPETVERFGPPLREHGSNGHGANGDGMNGDEPNGDGPDV